MVVSDKEIQKKNLNTVNHMTDSKKEKREITPHKGGRTEFLGARVLPETKEKADKLAKRKEMNMSDLLAFLVEKEYEKG